MLGCVHILGNINVYIASYLHRFDPNATLSKLILLLPTILLSMAATLWVGPFILRYGAKMGVNSSFEHIHSL